MSAFVEDPDHPGLYAFVEDAAGTSGWHTVESARVFWPDAPDDDILAVLLEVAKVSVIAFAPTLAAGVPVPTNYVYAQVVQARNIHNAGTVSTSGDFGNGEFSYAPRPLDWHVKQLLRPETGRLRVY